MTEFTSFLFENRNEVARQLLEHIELTLVSLAIATMLGIGLGIIIAVKENLSKMFLGLVNIIQTIPSLALLGFLLPLMGIGIVPAITALFLYALLPIVRNTYTGITQVDPAVKEAAIGIGLTRTQLLLKVELPLALPYIMAGIKTASVINVGVATLSAFIAAGGLGKFILQGIQLNNSHMILAGAIPASLLALLFDTLLGYLEGKSFKNLKRILIGFITVFFIYLLFKVVDTNSFQKQETDIKGGFPSEFIYREDGLMGLFDTYDLDFPYVEMEIGLLYNALKEKEVDVISGFSTDGRIKAYELTALEDDKNYFPPYEAAALLNSSVLEKAPDILKILNRVEGAISDSVMMDLNFRVDEKGKQPAEVAKIFLLEYGLIDKSSTIRKSNTIITIGSKAFTENYILAHIFALLIEYNSPYRVDLKLGFGGTKLLMDALKYNDVDLYPEYSGTALLLLLDEESDSLKKILKSPTSVYQHVVKESKSQFNFVWSKPLGFNNTFCMLMRENMAKDLEIKRISDLREVE